MKEKKVERAVIEVSFIIFLFYSNLLMGEYGRSGLGAQRGLLWAIEDIFTLSNFVIAVVAAAAGYFVFELFRARLP